MGNRTPVRENSFVVEEPYVNLQESQIALPSNSLNNIAPFNTPSPSETSVKASQTEKALSYSTPRKVHLREEVQRLKEELAEKEKQVRDLQKEVLSLEPYIQRCYQLLPKELAGIVETHVRNFGKSVNGYRFTNDIKATALMLHFLSPNTYKYLCENICTLPSVSTLRRFTQAWPSAPGNITFHLKALRMKYDRLTDFSKYCVICIDEMSLKCHLDYDRCKGEIIGLEDNGIAKTDKLAKHAFVLMVRGICDNWKMPLDYTFVGSSCSPLDVNRIVFEAVRGLRGIGFHPVALVSDMGPNFQALSLRLGVSPGNSSFTVDDQPLFYFFDTPHLLKLVKNNFEKYDIVFDGGKQASFGDIKHFYEIDSAKEFRLAPRLTNSHIFPNTFQKMSVKNSAQVLSHSVAAGVYTLVAGNKLSATATHTAEFVEKMDKLFDILNSSKPSDAKQMRRPFVGNEAQMEFLTESRNFIGSVIY